jgi:uncharacterized protein
VAASKEEQMSNIESAKAIYDAFGAGDMERLGRLFADDAQWISSDELPGGGTISGRDQILEGFGTVATAWKEFAVEPNEFIDGGRWVTVRGTQKATGNAGSFEAPYAHLLEFGDDGKLVRAEFYNDSAKAKMALGS